MMVSFPVITASSISAKGKGHTLLAHRDAKRRAAGVAVVTAATATLGCSGYREGRHGGGLRGASITQPIRHQHWTLRVLRSPCFPASSGKLLSADPHQPFQRRPRNHAESRLLLCAAARRRRTSAPPEEKRCGFAGCAAGAQPRELGLLWPSFG